MKNIESIVPIKSILDMKNRVTSLNC